MVMFPVKPPTLEDLEMEQRHVVDGDGNPAGGTTRVTVPNHGVLGGDISVVSILWQNGPLGRHHPGCTDERCITEGAITGPPGDSAVATPCSRVAPNGAFVETVIAAAIGRLEFYQRSKFKCERNHHAILHLKTALKELEHRTADRDVRGVEGTHEL